MKRVGIVVNYRKVKNGRFLDQLIKWFENQGIKVIMPESPSQNQEFMGASFCNVKFTEQVDMIITLGGDGTLLATARSVAESGAPILGINLGHLGFLTDLETPDLSSCLEKLSEGDYVIEPRMMLAAEVLRGDTVIADFYSLNDFVITKGPLSRIIRLETYVDDEYLATYRADGIIVASPTGSTAYSLSAGGPIVGPDLEVLIVTPVCPHTLYARPFVLADHKKVRIVLHSDAPDVMITIDGQIGFPLQRDDQVTVRKAGVYTNLVRLKNRPFFEVLRVKLRGSGLELP